MQLDPHCARNNFTARSRLQGAALVSPANSSTARRRGGPHCLAVHSSEPAVIIVDHGSRRAESNAMLEDFATAYRRSTGRSTVHIAHMEIAEPSIASAVADCVREGHAEIVIAPYFLSRGRHISTDIPALVDEAAAQHPGTRISIADPLGLDPLMVQLIEKRVQEALESTQPSTGSS